MRIRLLQFLIVSFIRCITGRLSLSHLEIVLRLAPGVLIQEGETVRLRVGQDIVHPGLCLELEEPAVLLRFAHHSDLIHQVFPRMLRVLPVLVKRIVHHVHIFPIQLHVGIEGSVGGGGSPHSSSVDIALNQNPQIPRLRISALVGILRIEFGFPQRIGDGGLHSSLLIDHLVGDVCMVHIHQLPVLIGGQGLLKTADFLRIQRHLPRIAAPHLICDSCIAGTALPASLVLGAEHHVGVRHGKVKDQRLQLRPQSGNGAYQHPPGTEALPGVILCLCAHPDGIAPVCLLIFLSIYRVFSHGLYGSVHRLHGKLGDLQLAPRIHGELRPVRALTLRRDAALPLGTRHYSVHSIVIETGEHHPTGLFHRGLPPVGAALLGVHHVTLLVQQRVIRIPIRGFNGEHRLVLVLRVVGDLVIPLHHRGQNLRRISVLAPHLRCLHAGGCVAASFRLIHQIPGSRAKLVKDGSSGDASVLHVQNSSMQICDEIPVAGLCVKGGDSALSVLIQAPRGVHIPCIGSKYQGIRVELKGIGGSVPQAVMILYLTGSVIPAPYQVVYFRLIVWQQEIAPFAVIARVDGDRS